MRAGGRPVSLVRAVSALTAVLAASLSSFSGTAMAAEDSKKDRKAADSAEAVADAPQSEHEETEPAPDPADAEIVAAEGHVDAATTTDRVKARSGPGVDQPAVRTLDKDTPVDITCQTQGGPVEGSKTWYQMADGTYVAGAFVSTPEGGSDSPECGAVEAAGNPAAVLASSIDEASSADPSNQAFTKVNAAAAATESVLFVVDTSGSMSGPRLDQAKAALRQGISSLTDKQAAGLRHFPASSYCGPGQLLVPIATGNRPALQTAVEGLVADGYTPTAAALRAAVADLPSSGTRTIVLISDGVANCNEDPCQTARNLVASGVKFTVQAVGFNVSGAAPAQLQCIADATGGRYFEATDGAGLAEAIKGAVSEPPGPSTGACRGAALIGVRGSGDNNNGRAYPGRHAIALAETLRNAWGIRLYDDDGDKKDGVIGLDYPAVSVLAAEGAIYHESVANGAASLRNEIIRLRHLCGPKLPILLAGYSQGADVVQRALAELDADAPDTPDFQSVAGVVILASPRFDPKDPVARGSFVADYPRSGIVDPLRIPARFRGVTRSWCVNDDPVCLSGKRNLVKEVLVGVHRKSYNEGSETGRSIFKDAAGLLAHGLRQHVSGKSVHPNPAGDLEVYRDGTGNRVRLSAGTIYARGAPTVRFAWDFNGDGSVDEVTTSPWVGHEYGRGRFFGIFGAKTVIAKVRIKHADDTITTRSVCIRRAAVGAVRC